MNESPLPNLIKLHCDGELSPQQDATLKQHLDSHPNERESLLQQIDFEKQLRTRVGDVMQAQCPKCPQHLHAAIRSAMAVDVAQTTETNSSATSYAGNPGLSNTSRSSATNQSDRMQIRRWFKAPQRTNIFAAAATLTLIAGAILYGIFGRGIDEIPPVRPTDLVASAAVYADAEHGECVGDRGKLKQAAPLTSPTEVQDDLQTWLGSPVKVFDLEKAGYEFIGAGHCDMPVSDRSGHLVYRKRPPVGSPANIKSPMLSVFVVPAGKGCHGKLCEGKKLGAWYPINGCKCVRKVMQSTDGKLVYFVVCCKDRDLEPVTQLMAMENPLGSR